MFWKTIFCPYQVSNPGPASCRYTGCSFFVTTQCRALSVGGCKVSVFPLTRKYVLATRKTAVSTLRLTSKTIAVISLWFRRNWWSVGSTCSLYFANTRKRRLGCYRAWLGNWMHTAVCVLPDGWEELVVVYVQVGISGTGGMRLAHFEVQKWDNCTCSPVWKCILPSQWIYCVFCVDLRTNSDYFSIQHWLAGFYNRDGVCLLRGTDWIFIYNSAILRSAHTVYLCVLCGSENKQRLFLYTTLTGWFL